MWKHSFSAISKLPPLWLPVCVCMNSYDMFSSVLELLLWQPTWIKKDKHLIKANRKKSLLLGCNKYGEFCNEKLSQHDVLEGKSILGNLLIDSPATYQNGCGLTIQSVHLLIYTRMGANPICHILCLAL